MNSRQKISNPNKKDYKRLLIHYKFNEEDATNLQEIKNMLNESTLIILIIIWYKLRIFILKWHLWDIAT